MRRPRRTHSPEFKAKVALAALKGDLTLAQLVDKFDVAANQITEWKKQLLRDVAPSTELRKWFDHDPKCWATFYQKYHAELKEQHLDEIDALVKKDNAGKPGQIYFEPRGWRVAENKSVTVFPSISRPS